MEDFIAKVIDEYKFAKLKGFDSIKIIIETNDREYIISEYEDGFVNDEVEYGCVYDGIDRIAEDVLTIIERDGYTITGLRIE